MVESNENMQTENESTATAAVATVATAAAAIADDNNDDQVIITLIPIQITLAVLIRISKKSPIVSSIQIHLVIRSI